MPSDLTILDLIEKEVGARVNPRAPVTPTTAGTTASQLFPQNPQRVAFLVVNLSTAVMYAVPGNTVSATTGIRIGPSGGAIIQNWRDDFVLPSLEWWILATVNASEYLLIELVLA